MDLSRYDAVLVCDANDFIAEGSGDPRYSASTTITGNDKGLYHYAVDYDDPRLHASNAFGKSIFQELNNWRNGWSAKVTDFGKWVVVEVTCHNFITGRSASKTFLVVFNGGPKGNDPAGGMVLSTSNKYRSISGYQQAVSYIKSASSSIENATTQKL